MSDEREQIRAAFETSAARIALFLVGRYRLSVDDARDVVHELFLKMLRQAEDGELPHRDAEHLLHHLIVSAESRAIDHLRKEARHRKSESTLLVTLSTVQPGAESQMISDEQQARLRAAIDALEEPYSQIFKLLVYEEMTLAEIARSLNIKAGTIYTQFARGVKKLREFLSDGM